MRPPVSLAPALLLLVACASRQSQPTAAPARELVVDEALLVEGRAAPDEHGLPPLPQPLPTTSDAFQRGHAQALSLLQSAGPPAPPAGADAAAYDGWTRGPFTRWMTERGEQTRVAVDALGSVQHGPASEHVVAAALVGLVYTRLTEQLHATPPPAHLSADGSLVRHYQSGLDSASDTWRQAAERAFFHCAKHAALQTDAAFGLWLQLCHDRLAALRQQRAEAEARAAALALEAEAERLKAAGPPPPGPEVCWKPHMAPRVSPSQPLTAGGDDRSSAGRSCALSSIDDAALAPPAPRSARDSLYGVRDVDSAVRVSVATEPLPSMDLRPLAAASAHAALAACHARHVEDPDAVTTAVHASLDVDARGRVTRASLAAEPSDAARAPTRALERCLAAALRKVRFDCSPDGRPTQAKALFCLRRD